MFYIHSSLVHSFRCLGSHIIKASGGFIKGKKKGLFFSFSAKHKRKWFGF